MGEVQGGHQFEHALEYVDGFFVAALTRAL